MKPNFVRNIQAQSYFDTFLVTGVTSILLLRFYLHVTGYPTVGGIKYHIAHMLYGGLLMIIALTIALAFLSEKRKVWIALIGGAGFGIFIDEVGKFITRDNNYFFRPSIGVIYASFVGLYLLFAYLSRKQILSSQEYQINALVQIQEGIRHDMDSHEKRAILQQLSRADQTSPLTTGLKTLVEAIPIIRTTRPNLFRRGMQKIEHEYARAWKRRRSNLLVQGFFIIETGVFVVLVGLALQNNLNNVLKFFEGQLGYGHAMVVGQLIGTIAAALLAVFGVVRLAKNRSSAFEWFRRAVFVNLLFTEFFIFSRIEFGALPSFLFNLGLLLFINFVIAQEKRTVQKVSQA